MVLEEAELAEGIPNAQFHIGDSRLLLPQGPQRVILGDRQPGAPALTLDDRCSVAEIYQRVRPLMGAEEPVAGPPKPDSATAQPAPQPGVLGREAIAIKLGLPLLGALGTGVLAGVGATLLAKR